MKLHCPATGPLHLVAVAWGLREALHGQPVELAGLDVGGAGRPQWRDGGRLPASGRPFREHTLGYQQPAAPDLFRRSFSTPS